jgi:hypothetical protein
MDMREQELAVGSDQLASEGGCVEATVVTINSHQHLVEHRKPS